MTGGVHFLLGNTESSPLWSLPHPGSGCGLLVAVISLLGMTGFILAQSSTWLCGEWSPCPGLPQFPPHAYFWLVPPCSQPALLSPCVFLGLNVRFMKV